MTEPKPAGVEMLKVFAPAPVDWIVPVVWPEAFVTEPGCPSVLPEPVAAKAAVAPGTGLLFASRRVIVTVELAEPSAVTPELGEAEIVEFAATGAPGIKVTVLVTVPKPAGVAMLTVLVSATVDLMVPEAWPEAFVVEPGWARVLPVPVEAKVTVWPLTGLSKASRSVTVTVLSAEPSAATPDDGEAKINEWPATAEPATNVTVPPDLVTGVAIWRVFVSAFVEVTVQVETPEALLDEQTP